MADFFSSLNLSSFGNNLFVIPTDAFYQLKQIRNGRTKTCQSINSLSTNEGSSESNDHLNTSKEEEDHIPPKVLVPFTSFLVLNWRQKIQKIKQDCNDL